MVEYNLKRVIINSFSKNLLRWLAYCIVVIKRQIMRSIMSKNNFLTILWQVFSKKMRIGQDRRCLLFVTLSVKDR